MITKRFELKEEILPNQTIQLRTATIVEEDGVELGRSYHRAVFHPGSNISKAPDEIKAIAEALWTPQVVANYKQTLVDEGDN